MKLAMKCLFAQMAEGQEGRAWAEFVNGSFNAILFLIISFSSSISEPRRE